MCIPVLRAEAKHHLHYQIIILLHALFKGNTTSSANKSLGATVHTSNMCHMMLI
jgi:hypothetical protein